ncbi:MAG: hypothetical protein R2784_16715 [Saprospiraceae bacterium]
MAFIAAFLGVIILTGISYFKANAEDHGTTTEFALNVCFLLGALVYTKSYHMAALSCFAIWLSWGSKSKFMHLLVS